MLGSLILRRLIDPLPETIKKGRFTGLKLGKVCIQMLSVLLYIGSFTSKVTYQFYTIKKAFGEVMTTNSSFVHTWVFMTIVFFNKSAWDQSLGDYRLFASKSIPCSTIQVYSLSIKFVSNSLKYCSCFILIYLTEYASMHSYRYGSKSAAISVFMHLLTVEMLICAQMKKVIK